MTLMVEPLTEVRATTPRGRVVRFGTRPDTSDTSLVAGIVEADEYGLGKLPRLSGWAIDVGAHIGTVALTLATDNPALQVIAVEALPENVEVLRHNVALNGLEDRIIVLDGAAGEAGEAPVEITYGWARSINQPDHYMHDNRYIGGMVGGNETSKTVTRNVVSLRDCLDLVDQTTSQYGPVALLKIDCEGCEWFFLRSPELHRVELILGEIHAGSHGGAAELRAMLEPTHDVDIEDSPVAHFRAVRR